MVNLYNNTDSLRFCSGLAARACKNTKVTMLTKTHTRREVIVGSFVSPGTDSTASIWITYSSSSFGNCSVNCGNVIVSSSPICKHKLKWFMITRFM